MCTYNTHEGIGEKERKRQAGGTRTAHEVRSRRGLGGDWGARASPSLAGWLAPTRQGRERKSLSRRRAHTHADGAFGCQETERALFSEGLGARVLGSLAAGLGRVVWIGGWFLWFLDGRWLITLCRWWFVILICSYVSLGNIEVVSLFWVI